MMTGQNVSEKLLGYQQFLRACSHFHNTNNLDHRSYFTTFHVRNRTVRASGHHIYSQVKNTLLKNGLGTEQQAVGVTLEYDEGGSRRRQITNETPHFHGLVIMPTDTERVDRAQICEWIDSAISKADIVASVETQFYEPEESLGATVDYSGKFAKLDTQSSSMGSERSCIYPFDLARRGKNDNCPRYQTWQFRYEKLLQRFYDAPRTFFSPEYSFKFGHELERIAKLGKSQSWYKTAVAA